MTSIKSGLLLILCLISFLALAPLAHADSYGYYATGSFQYDSNSISGNTGGICSGDCAPWGQLTVLSVTFSSSVVDYQESTSCSNSECETKLSGKFDGGALLADLSVGYPPQEYYLRSSTFGGSFETRFCTGDNCNSHRPETDLSLDFEGFWSNEWYSTGRIQLVCFERSGCTTGDGAGSLNTAVPEPFTLGSVLTGLPWIAIAIRRKRNPGALAPQRYDSGRVFTA
jgi:hypothetical protein